MVIATVFAIICGQGAKPFMGAALLMTGAYETVAGSLINYPKYMLMGFVLSSISIVVFAVLMKYILRPDVSKLSEISVDFFKKDPLPPMNTVQKIMSGILISFLLFFILPSVLPPHFFGVAFLNKLGAIGISLSLLAFLCVWRSEGKPLINFKDVVAKSVVWDIYFLICIAMAISGALTAKGTGITEFLGQTLEPVLGGHSSIMLLVILLSLSLSITQFANNGIMGVLFMPIIATFAPQAGLSFEGAATLVILILHTALLTPAASPYAAVLFGNEEWIDKRDISKYALFFVFATLATYLIFGLPLLELLYQ